MRKSTLAQRAFLLALASVPAVAGLALADDAQPVELVIENHRFQPAELHLPANQAAQIKVINKDDAAEEFESSDLKVEKVIPAGKSGVVRLRPLPVGRYPFIGEYHQETAMGVLVVE